jgi:hypothetical protein
MFKFVDLLFFFMLIISTSISIFIFRSNTVSRKPFHKIYSIILNPGIKHDEKIKLIEGLHSYLNDYSEEQILFDNFKFFQKESVFLYDVFFVVSFPIIVFLALSSKFPDAIKVLLIFITNTIIRLLTSNTIDLLLCKKLGISHVKRKSLMYTTINLAKKNALIILNSLIIFSIFLALFILFRTTMRDGESTIQLFNVMISEVRAYDIESINGNRFSLSELFFTLAISGTVIFSIINSHLKHKGKINEELNKQIHIYENWYQENEKSLSIKLTDIFNKNVMIDFYKAVDALSTKFVVKDFKILKAPIQRFYSLIVLIIISYLTAIFSVIAPPRFMNYLFLFFIVCCGLFIFNAYNIFKDYSD